MRTKLLGTALAMLFFCGSLAWLPALGQDRPGEGRGDEAKKEEGDGPRGQGRQRRRIQAVRRGDHEGGQDARPACSWSTGSTTRSSTRSRPTELGKEMLWVTQIEQTQSGYGYGGSPVGDRVVRWEQRGDDILLRDVKYEHPRRRERPDQGRRRGQLGRGDHRGLPDQGVRQGQGAR